MTTERWQLSILLEDLLIPIYSFMYVAGTYPVSRDASYPGGGTCRFRDYSLQRGGASKFN